MSSGELSGRIVGEGFPHNYLDDALNFSVESVEVVGEQEFDTSDDTVQLVRSDRRISIVGVPEWDEVTIGGTVEIPRKVFSGTLPREEREELPIELVVATRCSKTILRRGLSNDDHGISVDEEGEFQFSLTVERDDVRGEVEIKPYVVRAEHQSIDIEYASRTGDRLASTDSWILEVDEQEEDGGFLHPRIEPFDRHDSFPDGEHLHYLHFEDPSTPKLYLNANHGRLVDVLQNVGTRGADPRFRDVLYDYVEQSVWQQLLLRAASDIDAETGEVRHPWQEEVVELFEDELYPEIEDTEELRQKIAEDAASGDDLDILVHQIDLAIQRRIDHPQKAVDLFQEGLHND
jgi:hypothetical protein